MSGGDGVAPDFAGRFTLSSIALAMGESIATQHLAKRLMGGGSCSGEGRRACGVFVSKRH